MKRKELYQLIQPLTERLYRHAYCMVPDDLQAEQLIIDGTNAFLLKEKKSILNKHIDLQNKKDVLLYRRHLLKGILTYLNEIGSRRAVQLSDQMKLSRPSEFAAYFSLDPKVRSVLRLRFDENFTVEEIGTITQMPRYEVIEKLHNGRFLLLHDLNKGVSP